MSNDLYRFNITSSQFVESHSTKQRHPCTKRHSGGVPIYHNWQVLVKWNTPLQSISRADLWFTNRFSLILSASFSTPLLSALSFSLFLPFSVQLFLFLVPLVFFCPTLYSHVTPHFLLPFCLPPPPLLVSPSTSSPRLSLHLLYSQSWELE